ncbi:hypothetical protein HK102_004624 [Quaeritorhiza haematococci]|nr:hypothetical protein HK102_004624 [Quaeritorhiza haematococci]
MPGAQTSAEPVHKSFLMNRTRIFAFSLYEVSDKKDHAILPKENTRLTHPQFKKATNTSFNLKSSTASTSAAMRATSFLLLTPLVLAAVGLWNAETVAAAGQKYYGNGYYDKNYHDGKYNDYKDGGYGYEKYKDYKDGYKHDNKYYDDKKNSEN